MPDFYVRDAATDVPPLPKELAALESPYPRAAKLERYELGCKGRISVMVYPGIGFKSSGLSYRGVDIEPRGEMWDPFLYYAPFWGASIMYPTPNRVREGVFTFRDKTVTMEKFGLRRDLHGLAYDSSWTYQPPVCTSHGISFHGWLEMHPGDDNYAAFPYPNRVSATYLLEEDRLRWRYCVENLGDSPMPFGIGLHPYLCVHASQDDLSITAQTRAYYETTPALLPTGRRIPVEAKPAWDLRCGKEVRELCCDTVFETEPGAPIVVRYPRHGFTMTIRATAEFGHMVLHTPMQLGQMPCTMPWIFAVENQTCCTDAINLYHRGDSATGLLILAPGEAQCGEICYEFAPCSD